MITYVKNTLQCLFFSVICFSNIFGSLEKDSTTWDVRDDTSDTAPELGQIENPRTTHHFSRTTHHFSTSINSIGTEANSEIGSRSLFSYRRTSNKPKPHFSLTTKPGNTDFGQSKTWFEQLFEPSSVSRRSLFNRDSSYRNPDKYNFIKPSKYSEPSKNIEKSMQNIFSPPARTYIPPTPQNVLKRLFDTNYPKIYKPPSDSMQCDQSRLVSKDFLDCFMKQLFQRGKTTEKNSSPIVSNSLPFNGKTFNSPTQSYLSKVNRLPFPATYEVFESPLNHRGELDKLINKKNRNGMADRPLLGNPPFSFQYPSREAASPFHSTSLMLTNILSGLLPTSPQQIRRSYPLDSGVDYRKEFLRRHSQNTETDSTYRRPPFLIRHTPDVDLSLSRNNDPKTIRLPVRPQHPSEGNDKGYSESDIEIDAPPKKLTSDSTPQSPNENVDRPKKSPNFPRGSPRQQARKKPPNKNLDEDETQTKDEDESKRNQVDETPTHTEDESLNDNQPQTARDQRPSEDDLEKVTEDPILEIESDSQLSKKHSFSSQDSMNEQDSSLEPKPNKNNGFSQTSEKQNSTQRPFEKASEDFYLQYLSSSLIKPKEKKTRNKYRTVEPIGNSKTPKSTADGGDGKKHINGKESSSLPKKTSKYTNRNAGKENKSEDDDDEGEEEDEEVESKYDDTSNDSV